MLCNVFFAKRQRKEGRNWKLSDESALGIELSWYCCVWWDVFSRSLFVSVSLLTSQEFILRAKPRHIFCKSKFSELDIQMIETSPFYHLDKILSLETTCSFLLGLELLFVLAVNRCYDIAECHNAPPSNIIFLSNTAKAKWLFARKRVILYPCSSRYETKSSYDPLWASPSFGRIFESILWILFASVPSFPLFLMN